MLIVRGYTVSVGRYVEPVYSFRDAIRGVWRIFYCDTSSLLVPSSCRGFPRRGRPEKIVVSYAKRSSSRLDILLLLGTYRRRRAGFETRRRAHITCTVYTCVYKPEEYSKERIPCVFFRSRKAFMNTSRNARRDKSANLNFTVRHDDYFTQLFRYIGHFPSKNRNKNDQIL